MTDVVIAGAGPTGLMLACELSLAGIRPIVLERLREPSAEPKANGLVGQVVPMLDRRGLHTAISGDSAAPQPNSSYFMFAAMPLNLGVLAHSPVYNLPVPQARLVEVLTERAGELGVEIRRDREIVGLTQDGNHVTVEVSEGDKREQIRARYLVGADGAHSVIRKLSGIDFPGVSYDRTTARTVHATVPPEWVDPATGGLRVPGIGVIRPFLPHRTDTGGFSYAPFPGHPPLISTSEWDQPESDEPLTLDEMQASVTRVLGAEIPLTPPTGDGPHLLRRLVAGNTRMAERFRDRRVFLVGDAAHVFSVMGGPGLNVGLQDSINLGWKLAAALHGTAPDGLLDSYELERGQVAHRTVVSAQAQSALVAPGSDVTALREVFGELLTDESTVRRLADLIAGTDTRYDMGVAKPHPLVGYFAPDLPIHLGENTVRLSELVRNGRPLLLDLGGGSMARDVVAGWGDRVDVVTGWIDAVGEVPEVLLIRPDSYVAWAGSASGPETGRRDALDAALRRWFGAAQIPRR
ncbi:FAD-dependent oxidoreductase [Nocardia cyriacigeorgica]|uniref:FAD-dependent oxidoreductase n=1 Tax=Nocardia cyriacigeorgica TaxID=135487 RepID=A0A6P1D5V1_9NOCA|nr:FAD-dependent oxidoreductase [Nocardia cyriacigeorgica]NEW43572.1 FAD-dependent oxidoreductase [Nocardia cyriacigeorgica]NEW49492.1 FAD-dependent oxidoreductase [Nocardia cyriacigeorgica]NEW54104.1 FAD-dependent oxidoreductase [Nocardia cyriacigeorgica]